VPGAVTGVTAGGLPAVPGAVTGVTAGGLPAVNSTAGTFGKVPALTGTGAGVSWPAGVSVAALPGGLAGVGGSISAAGGSAPWPAQPYGNPVPWAAGGQTAGQGMASGSGHGGGTGMAAVLAASLLIITGVLRLRRRVPLGPRSAWLSALEVPG